MTSRLLWCTLVAATAAALAADTAAELLLGGFPSLQAVAVNPQGAPMVAAATWGGGIARVLGRTESLLLAETSGEPTGLAFDAAGDLYVADKRLGYLFRITPWGRLDTIVENLKAPQSVTVAPSGDIYVTETGAARVRRFTPGGEPAVFSGAVSQPGGIVASADGRHIFVSGARTIWRFAPDGAGRTRFASLAGEGMAAGLALDEKGNLYVARNGGGVVSVLSAQGEPAGEYRVPGKQVTAVAFGGYDLNILHITEAGTGGVYRVRVPHRSQRLLWEPSQPLRITEPADGAILNRHDGEPAASGLRIQVKGLLPAGTAVKVNGTAAAVRNGEFQSALVLQNRENRIVVEAPGGQRDEITVLWDHDSFKRYRFSTDDNIWFLRDLARNAARYTSIFDNPYMAFWREMHRKYGARIHHNIYYETAGFNLSQMPDKFRGEWRANASWLRLSFHARANQPARPYTHASAEKIRADYRAVNREIERFAGKELMSPVTTLHWSSATRAAAQALREEGVRVLLGAAPFRDDLPYVGYYLSIPQMRSIIGRDYWKDTRLDVVFLHHDMVVNHFTPDEVVPALERIAADPHESEVIELIIHEQYFYPDYVAYEPDYRERVERAIEWVTRKGYKPVFFEEGFLGTGKE